jgi:chemotaxis protein methyltransferase CheR
VALAPDTVAAIAQRLAEHAGLELPAWVVEARAAARIAVLGCSPDDYVALIDTGRGASELAELIEAVRVGESRLFRHRSQVEALADVVAPALRARGRRTIRVWSAGCAAGEEPYTLALVLSRALPDCTIAITATDVSADALAQAQAATYPRAALQHVPEPYRDRFLADGDAVRVAPEIVALVKFERANLLDGAAPRGCDLVWCRNVLIYFTADARRRVIDRLVGAAVPGGFVFVGYSESLRDIAELDGMRAGDAI